MINIQFAIIAGAFSRPLLLFIILNYVRLKMNASDREIHYVDACMCLHDAVTESVIEVGLFNAMMQEKDCLASDVGGYKSA